MESISKATKVPIDTSKDSDDDAIPTDFINVLLDKSSDVLQDNFFENKKKLANAQNGKDAIYEKLRQKTKVLEMLNMVLTSNKDLMKTEDLFYGEDLHRLLSQSKNDKTIFESISKKVKASLALITKNQISIENTKNYSKICEILIDILNMHFEASFLQQVLDIIKSSDDLFNIFVKALFEKYFKGRNTIMKNQDLRYLIKLTFNSKGPFYYISIIMQYCDLKENGGGRTPHQLKQAIDLVNYVLDQFGNKISNKKDKHSKEETKFDVEKYLCLHQSFHAVIASVAKRIKHLGGKSDEELKASKELHSLLEGLINIVSKLVSFMKKNTQLLLKNTEEGKTSVKSLEFIVTNVRKLLERIPNLKNFEEKLVGIEEYLN